MAKIDLKRTYSQLFNTPKGSFAEIVVPAMPFVKVAGAGDPNSALAYRTAVEWLYVAAFIGKGRPCPTS